MEISHRLGNLVDLGSKDMLRAVTGTSCYDRRCMPAFLNLYTHCSCMFFVEYDIWFIDRVRCLNMYLTYTYIDALSYLDSIAIVIVIVSIRNQWHQQQPLMLGGLLLPPWYLPALPKRLARGNKIPALSGLSSWPKKRTIRLQQWCIGDDYYPPFLSLFVRHCDSPLYVSRWTSQYFLG